MGYYINEDYFREAKIERMKQKYALMSAAEESILLESALENALQIIEKEMEEE